jgi:hypothetical protein
MNVREIVKRIGLFKAYADSLRKQLYDMTVARDAAQQEVAGLRRTIAVMVKQAGGEIVVDRNTMLRLDQGTRLEVRLRASDGAMVITTNAPRRPEPPATSTKH